MQKTGVKNVSYAGHSQGTQQMFAALSENLDFFKTKINVCLMLAPITRIDRMSYGLIQKVKNNDTLF